MVRSEPWRRTANPQKRTARKLLLPRAYSASGGPFPRPKTYSGAGMVRSEPWRRTSNPQKRTARKLFLLRAYSASGGPMPRSPLKDINIVCSVPFYVNRWDPQAIRAERCRAVASLGGEHPHPSRKARKIILPRAYSASGGPIPRSHRNDRSRVESVPFCVNSWDRPLLSSSRR